MNTAHQTRWWIVPLVLCVSAFAPGAWAGIAENIMRTRVAGADVIVYPMDVSNVVTVRGSFPGGDFQARGGNIAAATIAGMLLDKGTETQDRFAIAQQLDDVGAALGFGVTEQMVTISGKSLKKDLPLLVRLLAEELRTPAFSAEEFAKAKIQLEATLKSSLDDTDFRAQELFARAAFPAGHPNRPDESSAWLAALEKLTLEDVKNFHREHYGPEHLKLVFAGDVDARAIRTQVAKAFGGWKGGVAAARVVNAGPAGSPQAQRVRMSDKTSVTVLLGQATGLQYRDVDSIALRIGATVLGSGFTGRLMSAVRDREGLTYGIGAKIADDTFVDGTFTISATFAPSLLEKGIASTRRELEKWYSEGVTASELEARKSYLIGSYQVGLATTDGMAGVILATLDRSKPLTWLDDYSKMIEAATLEEVNGAIRKHLDPDNMTLIEAGTFD